MRVVPLMSLTEARRERRIAGYRQCSGVFITANCTCIFCIRHTGHEGNHRGEGAEWTNNEAKP